MGSRYKRCPVRPRRTLFKLDAVWQPEAECPRCGRYHRSWHTLARCRWSPLLWVSGNPPADGPCYATVSRCAHPRFRTAQTTVCLWQTLAEADAAMKMIGATGCGGACSRDHELVEMRPARVAGVKAP